MQWLAGYKRLVSVTVGSGRAGPSRVGSPKKRILREKTWIFVVLKFFYDNFKGIFRVVAEPHMTEALPPLLM